MVKQSITVRHRCGAVPVTIAAGLFTGRSKKGGLGHYLKGRSYCIISNKKVASLYATRLERAFGSKSKAVITIPDSERAKSFPHLEKTLTKLLQHGIHRNDVIVALGGGVVGDFAGFCAATYLRGVALLMVPTTLLAQVDSSIGGKVAINLLGADSRTHVSSKGKNMVGAFYPPEAILTDTNTVATLEQNHLAEGFAETIKHMAIADASLFSKYECQSWSALKKNLPAIITASAAIKAAVVSKDEFEAGIRMQLNFGHSFGHAIELLGNFKRYRHGQAVAMGMVMATCFSIEHRSSFGGTLTQHSLDRLTSFLGRCHLPTHYPLNNPKTFLEAMRRDKKNQDGFTLILLKKIGKAAVVPVPEATLLRFLQNWQRASSLARRYRIK